MKAELEENLTDIERKISIEENKYIEQLHVMKLYEKRLDSYDSEIDDVLKYKGYLEMRDSIVKEISEIVAEIGKNEDLLKKEKSKKKKYDMDKKKVNDKYYSLMLYDKERFCLKEISESKLRNIKSVIKAGGSNKPIATVIWYMNLLKIKREFNKEAIVFPIVFDSPNNAETDEEKRRELLKYLFDSVDEDTQLIISALGFEEEEFQGVNINKVIKLDNDKYQVLNNSDYNKYKQLFIDLMGNDM